MTRSQIDLVYGFDGIDDTRSLSGVSIGSKGSSRGSEDNPHSAADIAISKSNKGKTSLTLLSRSTDYLSRPGAPVIPSVLLLIYHYFLFYVLL